VISLISIQGGTLKKGDRIASCHTRKKYEIVDIGLMHPEVGERCLPLLFSRLDRIADMMATM
jgi:translation elongation factor EF-4